MRPLMSRASGTLANRLLTDHLEMAGAGEAGVAAGSQILKVQERRMEEIADAIHRRIGQAAGVGTIAVSGDLDHVRVDIGARNPAGMPTAGVRCRLRLSRRVRSRPNTMPLLAT